MIYGDGNGDGIADLAIQVNGVSSLKAADLFL
jgi:hypothetical protein